MLHRIEVLCFVLCVVLGCEGQWKSHEHVGGQIPDSLILYDDIDTALTLGSSVYRLRICDYGVEALPSSIDSLSNLREVVFCKRLPLDMEKTISTLCEIRSLKRIDLSNTGLVSVPRSLVPECKIDYLNLQNNYLRNLPADFGNLPELRVCLLGSNYLTDIPHSFCNLKRLETLDLSHNEMLDAGRLMHCLSKLPNLRNLDIRGLRIDEHDFADISFDSLRTISISKASEGILSKAGSAFPCLAEVRSY